MAKTFSSDLKLALQTRPELARYAIEIRPTRAPLPQLENIFSDIDFSQSPEQVAHENSGALYSGIGAQLLGIFPLFRRFSGSVGVTTAKFGRSTLLAAEFDGTGSYLEFNGAFWSRDVNSVASWAIAIEFRLDATGVRQTLFAISDNSTTGEPQDALQFNIEVTDELQVKIKSLELESSGAASLMTTGWHVAVIVGTDDGGTGTDVEFYLDGTDVTPGANNIADQVPEIIENAPGADHTTIFGAERDNGTYDDHFTGRLGRIIAWGAALSSGEVDDIFKTIQRPYLTITGSDALSSDLGDYHPVIHQIHPVEASIDEVTHKRTEGRLVATFVDVQPNGPLRQLIVGNPGQSFHLAMKLGHPDAIPDDWAVVQQGHLQDYRALAGNLIELDAVELSKSIGSNYKASGSFIGHPLSVCEQLLVTAGVPGFLYDAESFSPKKTGHEDFLHLNVGRWISNSPIEGRRTPDVTYPIYKLRELDSAPIDDHLHQLASLCDGSIIIDEFGRVAFRPFAPNAVPAVRLTEDDYSDVRCLSSIDNIANQLVFTTFANADGRIKVDDTRHVQIDHLPAQEAGAFGTNLGRQVASMEIDTGSAWLDSGCVKGNRPGFDETDLTSLPVVANFLNLAWFGVSGHHIPPEQRFDGGVQDADFRPNPGAGRYVYLMHLIPRDDSDPPDSIVTKGYAATSIFRITSVDPPDWSILTPMRPQNQLTGVRDVFPLSSNMTIDAIEVFSENPALGPTVLEDFTVLLDVTIPIFLAKRRLGRFKDGAPKYAMRVASEFSFLEEGDLVLWDNRQFLHLGLDGTDSGGIGDPVFEVTRLRRPQDTVGGLEIEITWLRNGPTFTVVPDGDIIIRESPHQSFYAAYRYEDSAGGPEKKFPMGVQRDSSFDLTTNSPNDLDFLVDFGIATALDQQTVIGPDKFRSTVSPSVDTYLYIDRTTGRFVQRRTALGAGTPTAADIPLSVLIPLWKIVSDATMITSTTDLRPTSYMPSEVVDPQSTCDLGAGAHFFWVPGEATDCSISRYATWAEAHAARVLHGAKYAIIHISERTAPAVMDLGSYDMTGIRLIATGPGTTFVEVPEGVTFTGDKFPEIADYVVLDFTGSTAPFSIGAGEARQLTCERFGGLRNSGTGAFVELTDATASLTASLDLGARLINATFEVVDLQVSGATFGVLFYNAVDKFVGFDNDVLRGVAGSIWNVVQLGPSNYPNATQTNFLGTRVDFSRIQRLQPIPLAGGTPSTAAIQLLQYGHSLRVDPSLNAISILITDLVPNYPGGDCEVIIATGTWPEPATNAVTIFASGGATIDNKASLTLTRRREHVRLRSDGGSNWSVVSRRGAAIETQKCNSVTTTDATSAIVIACPVATNTTVLFDTHVVAGGPGPSSQAFKICALVTRVTGTPVINSQLITYTSATTTWTAVWETTATGVQLRVTASAGAGSVQWCACVTPLPKPVTSAFAADLWSFNFDGVDEQLDLPTGLLGSGVTKLAVVQWVKFSSFTDGDELFRFRTTASPGLNACRAEVFNTGTQLRFRTHTAASTNHFTISAPASATWGMIAFVYDGTQAVANDRVKVWYKFAAGAAVEQSGTHVGTHPTALENLNDPHTWYFSFAGNAANQAIFKNFSGSFGQTEVDACHASDKPANLNAHSKAASLVHWTRNGDNPSDSPTGTVFDNQTSNPVSNATAVNMELADKQLDAP